MRTAILVLVTIVAAVPVTGAQEADSPAGVASERITHFLIDDSGSMAPRQQRLNQALEAKRRELASQGFPPAIETRFGGSNGGACGSSIVIGETDTGVFRQDETQLGEALETVLLGVGEEPTDVFLFSDEEQTPGCGPDICTVAERLLPMPGVFVQSIGIAPDPINQDRLSCVRIAQDYPQHPPKVIEFNFNMSQDLGATGGEVDWDGAAWLARWAWLLIFVIIVLGAGVIGLRWLLIALAFERRSSDIQQRERLILTAQGNAEDHRKAIARLVNYSGPQGRLLPSLKLVGIGILFLGSLLGAILLFGEVANPLVDLSSARKLAWFVLSSGFSSGFAILGIAPILVSGAQYLRAREAKEDFALTANAAAEEEAKRRATEDAKEIEDLLLRVQNARDQVARTAIETRWAEPPRLAFGRKTPAFDAQDRERLEIVKDRLRHLIQGDAPTRTGATKDLLTSRLDFLQPYLPRKWIWERNWKLDNLIRDLDQRDPNLFGDEGNDWRDLADRISRLSPQRIRVLLRRLAGEAPENRRSSRSRSSA